MDFPSLSQAGELLTDAAQRNPGPWVQHSRNVAEAAQRIAAAHPGLDRERAYILGLLHDIGRREGVYGMRHVVDGYRFLSSLGYEDAARISMTHSFPVADAHAGSASWDCTPEELSFVQEYLHGVEYDDYDRLIMLCDSLALPDGFCLMEKRLVDVVLRYGFNSFTQAKWLAYFEILHRFEREIGQSIYTLLPGVVEGTFGSRVASSNPSLWITKTMSS